MWEKRPWKHISSDLPEWSEAVECLKCGTCCVAPDISSLDKPPAAICIHLDDDHCCSRYETRPAVCRSYRPDEICRLIAAPTLEERVVKYLQIFDME